MVHILYTYLSTTYSLLLKQWKNIIGPILAAICQMFSITFYYLIPKLERYYKYTLCFTMIKSIAGLQRSYRLITLLSALISFFTKRVPVFYTDNEGFNYLHQSLINTFSIVIIHFYLVLVMYNLM